MLKKQVSFIVKGNFREQLSLCQRVLEITV